MMKRHTSMAEKAQAMPIRQASGASGGSDDAVPVSDPNDTSELLAERLQAWKHAVGYLEAYVTATEKMQRAHAKEYEKVLKSISDPLREGNHFDQSLGGIAGMFENMRANTQGLVNDHLETEKNLKGTVLPILDRLHKEIKNKSKELASGAAKGAKEVEKARNTTQKHIELLGQQAAAFESSGGRTDPTNDPYVVHRGIFYRLNKQVLEENNNRRDLLSVQENFSVFEGYVIEVIQQAMAAFNQFMGVQHQNTVNIYADMLGSAQKVPLNFEWDEFVKRNGAMLVDPAAKDRSVDDIKFPNQNHAATKPLIEGTLERKSRNKLSFSGYSTGYYVVTPSKFLHEFKDNDNFRKDPEPELSIYLPDAVIGTPSGDKFNVKGRDVAKGFSSKLSGNSEIAFKAHNTSDAEKWYEIIKNAAGATGSTTAHDSEPSTPISPAPGDQKRIVSQPPAYEEKGKGSGTAEAPHAAPIQTQGITGGETVASPATATPVKESIGK